MVRMFTEADITYGQRFMSQKSIAQTKRTLHLELRPLDMAKHQGP